MMFTSFLFRVFSSLFGALLCCIASTLAHAEPEAHFLISEEVVNRDLQPFTATIERIGNGSRLSSGSGFEPRVFRTMIQTTRRSRNRILAPASAISHYDSWRSGALDGAEVEILRIENGTFRSVRFDRIRVGGHQASGWRNATPRGRVISGDVTSFEFVWDRWNRPGAAYYFTVRAVDQDARLSAAAESVVVMAPEAFPSERPEANNQITEMDISGGESGLAGPINLEARVSEEGLVRLTWNPVLGAAGYVVYRSDVPPSEHLGYYIELEGEGPEIEGGDLAIIRTTFRTSDREARLTNRVWSTTGGARAFRINHLHWSDETGMGRAELVDHEPHTIVEEPGETFLRMTLEEGETKNLGHWNHSGLGQDWYEVLEPGRRYRFEVWMRGHSDRPATFEVTGFHGQGEGRIRPMTFSVTPEWQQYTATFEVPMVNPGRQAGQTRLRFVGPGVFDVDNFRVFRDDAPFLAFLPEDVARIEASGMGMLRTHSFIKTGRATYDLSLLTNPGGVANFGGGNTLPQTLAAIDRLGMDPWLQIEPHLTRSEWLGLVEYLAAPFDPARDDPNALPWAAKRSVQGHGPWVDSFDRILFEIGNETWNSLFEPWTFPPMTDSATGARYNSGTVYGLYQEYVLAILRESPHWPALSDRIEPVIGGWSGSSGWWGFDYGLDAAIASPNTPLMTHAAYNGGWEEEADPAQPDVEGMSAILTHVLQSGTFLAIRHRDAADRIGAERGAPLATGTYEAGPGYIMDGLNGRRISPEQADAQEMAMKSVAAGTATLDAFLMRAAEGQVVQNFFTYGSGERWTSHAHWYMGGQTYPSWDLLAAFNTEALGDMLAVETLATPTIDLPEQGRRQAVDDAPLIAAYATRSDDRLSVFVISRRVPRVAIGDDGVTSVTIDLPITAADSLTRISQTGDLQSHNVDSQGSRLLYEPQDVPDTLPRLEIPALPPGETLIFLFDGVR